MALATAVAAVVPLAGVSAPASMGASGKAAAPSKVADKATIVPGRYIVMTKGAALSSYRGGVTGMPRTRPMAGHKLNVRTAAARQYRKHLLAGHRTVLARAGVPRRANLHDYSVAFNGFSARLTKAQAQRLGRTRGVLKVWPVEMRTSDTVSTPNFLGLDGSTGVWQKQFGGNANAGRGIIVADLDSGIWPENPSFAPLASTPDQALINAKWHGICDPGVQQPISCNNKLIGARYYGASFGNRLTDDFNSPRDFNGHGSHTASTAAGNHGVPVVINGIPFGDASGMAPAARIAVYKVLWENLAAGNASGTTAGIVAAIDDAVADGADVINYSISGSSTSIVSPDEIAFLGAADAGVFVSASAGNSGPGASTVAHNAPWEMTVAASTHDRGAVKTVTLGNGASYQGLGYGAAVPTSPIVSSTVSGVTGADPTKATQCWSKASNGGTAVLDPAKVTGKIVMCTRGVNARVDKSLAVKEAGGIGMVLIDTPGASPTADFHSVPSIHVNFADGQQVKTYVDANVDTATASISATDSSPVEAPSMAGFSSAGPALAGGGDLLKPDITAPGVSVIAAVAPPGNGGFDFNSYDGTSMAAPHITGIAALIKQKHPSWSPMWIKSAIMTTATTLTNRGNPIQRAGVAATPLDYGSGHVQPAPAFDPGLVYDSSFDDWAAYICAIGQLSEATCASFPSIDPSDFNSPSIAIGALPGKQTVTRTFTNTSPNQASQFKATIQAPPGMTVTVNDDKITVPPMQSRSYKLTITRTNAAFSQWAFGSITWTDKRGHSVRSPIAVRPVVGAVPSAVTGNGQSGSTALSVTPGYDGTLTASVSGLVPATVDTTAPTAAGATANVTVTIPADTTYARFATYDADYAPGTDVDILVKLGATTVGSSGGATAEESVNLENPAPGTYTVQVTYFAGATPTLAMKLNSFALGTASAGNMTATPASQTVTAATPTTVTAAWSGLQANTRYLGAVNFGDGTSTFGRTLVSILP